MTSVLSVRRRAEQFNSLVEGTSAGSPRDANLSACLELVTAMREMTPAEPRPEFTSSLRDQLLAAADTLLLPSQDTQRLTLPPRRTARDRRIAAVVGGFAVVGATASLAVAAQEALPGEMLYPLKRALENAETGIHTTDEAKGASLLANATDRLAEVTALSRTSDLGEGDTIASTLTTFSDQAILASDLLLADYAETGDADSIEELRGFTADSMQTLTQLEGLLPTEARDEMLYAAEVLGQIDAAASEACPGCRGGITEIPSFLYSAGRVAEPDVIVVPPVLRTDEPSNGGGGGGGKRNGDKTGGGDGTQGGGSDGPLTTPIDPGTPDTDSGGGTTGGGGGSTDPLDVLTDPLTGGGGSGTASNGGGGTNNGGGGITGIPEVDDVIDDVDDTLPDLP